MENIWTLTSSGKRFDLLDPKPQQVDIRDIARHLSRINRFNGATHEPYSVAQHSVMVSAIATELSNSPLTGLYGLLHDAHEAYIGDITSPVKGAMAAYADDGVLDGIADIIDGAIYEKLGLPWVPDQDRKIIKIADMIALATEKHFLLHDHPDWQMDIKPWAAITDLPCLGHKESELLFLKTFVEMKESIEFLANETAGAA